MLIGTEEMHNLYNSCHQNGSSYDAELHLKQKLEFLEAVASLVVTFSLTHSLRM